MKMFKISETEYINLDNVAMVCRNESELSDDIEVYFVGENKYDCWHSFPYTDNRWNRLVKAMEAD